MRLNPSRRGTVVARIFEQYTESNDYRLNHRRLRRSSNCLQRSIHPLRSRVSHPSEIGPDFSPGITGHREIRGFQPPGHVLPPCASTLSAVVLLWPECSSNTPNRTIQTRPLTPVLAPAFLRVLCVNPLRPLRSSLAVVCSPHPSNYSSRKPSAKSHVKPPPHPKTQQPASSQQLTPKKYLADELCSTCYTRDVE